MRTARDSMGIRTRCIRSPGGLARTLPQLNQRPTRSHAIPAIHHLRGSTPPNLCNTQSDPLPDSHIAILAPVLSGRLPCMALCISHPPLSPELSELGRERIEKEEKRPPVNHRPKLRCCHSTLARDLPPQPPPNPAQGRLEASPLPRGLSGLCRRSTQLPVGRRHQPDPLGTGGSPQPHLG